MALQKMKILRTPAVFSSNFPFSEDLSNHCFFFSNFAKKFGSCTYIWVFTGAYYNRLLVFVRLAPSFRALSGKTENDI